MHAKDKTRVQLDINGGKMKRIAFINNKGGVSKTTSTIAVANILADEYGKKVLLVDMDPQRNTTTRFTETDYFDIFENLMYGKDIMREDKSIEDVLMDPGIDLKGVIKKTKYTNIDILPAQLTLSSIEETLRQDYKRGYIQTRLKEALMQVDDDYDYCIIDCGPSVGLINVNALVAAEDVYIPIRPDGDSLVGMAITRNLVNEVANLNESLEIAGIFFTCFKSREKMSKGMRQYLEDFLSEFDLQLLPIEIGVSAIVAQQTTTKLSLSELDDKSKITNNYRDLVKYIIAPNKKLFLKDYIREE